MSSLSLVLVLSNETYSHLFICYFLFIVSFLSNFLTVIFSAAFKYSQLSTLRLNNRIILCGHWWFGGARWLVTLVTSRRHCLMGSLLPELYLFFFFDTQLEMFEKVVATSFWVREAKMMTMWTRNILVVLSLWELEVVLLQHSLAQPSTVFKQPFLGLYIPSSSYHSISFVFLFQIEK